MRVDSWGLSPTVNDIGSGTISSLTQPESPPGAGQPDKEDRSRIQRFRPPAQEKSRFVAHIDCIQRPASGKSIDNRKYAPISVPVRLKTIDYWKYVDRVPKVGVTGRFEMEAAIA